LALYLIMITTTVKCWW